MGDTPAPEPEASVQFLLAEYQQWVDAWQRNEEIGDRRVTLFITLTTFVAGGSAVLASSDAFSADNRLLIFLLGYGLIGLWMFGAFTLARLVERNLETDGCHQALRVIGQYFVRLDPGLHPHVRFDPASEKQKRSFDYLSLGTGGLLQTVILINCLIPGILPAMLILGSDVIDSGWAAYSAGTVSSVVLIAIGWVIQVFYVRQKYRSKSRLDERANTVNAKMDELVSKLYRSVKI